VKHDENWGAPENEELMRQMGILEKGFEEAMGKAMDKMSIMAMGEAMEELLADLKKHRPEDRDHPKARHYAITITELEKVVAYYKYWVVMDDA
jgi:hypothetical protein